MASVSMTKKKQNQRQRKIQKKKKIIKSKKKLKINKRAIKETVKELKKVKEDANPSSNKCFEEIKISKPIHSVNKKKKGAKKGKNTPKSSESQPKESSTFKPEENGSRGDAEIPRGDKPQVESETFTPVTIIPRGKDRSTLADANWRQMKKLLDLEAQKKPKKFVRRKEEISAAKDSEKKVWFDGVEPKLLEDSTKEEKKADDVKPIVEKLVDDNAPSKVTRVIAMDCEMVGVGWKGAEDMLARVSIVNMWGKVLYDHFVKPTEHVADYRTEVSGVRPEDLRSATKDFKEAQYDVSEFLKKRILVGHSLSHDLHCLLLKHAKSKIRDTSKYRPFRKIFGGRTPSLRKLTERLLGIKIQSGEHNSVEDARAAMRLYALYRKEWEAPRIGYRRERAARKQEKKQRQS